VSIQRAITLAIGVMLVVAVAVGFSIIGTPAHERLIAIDAQTIDQMKSIAAELARDRHDRGTLPATLSRVHDGEAGSAISYRRLDASRFTLCSVFYTTSSPDEEPGYAHRRGHVCFSYDVSGDSTDPRALSS
jgi:hypothetical protein